MKCFLIFSDFVPLFFWRVYSTTLLKQKIQVSAFNNKQQCKPIKSFPILNSIRIEDKNITRKATTISYSHQLSQHQKTKTKENRSNSEKNKNVEEKSSITLHPQSHSSSETLFTLRFSHSLLSKLWESSYLHIRRLFTGEVRTQLTI